MASLSSSPERSEMVREKKLSEMTTDREDCWNNLLIKIYKQGQTDGKRRKCDHWDVVMSDSSVSRVRCGVYHEIYQDVLIGWIDRSSSAGYGVCSVGWSRYDLVKFNYCIFLEKGFVAEWVWEVLLSWRTGDYGCTGWDLVSCVSSWVTGGKRSGWMLDIGTGMLKRVWQGFQSRLNLVLLRALTGTKEGNT